MKKLTHMYTCAKNYINNRNNVAAAKKTMKTTISTSELMWIGLKDTITSKLLPRL